MRPGPGVLAAFGARADPVSLPGGEGTAWRAGEAVLKPRQHPEPRQDRPQREENPPRLARDTHAQAKKWGVQGGARSPLVEAAQLPDLEVCNG